MALFRKLFYRKPPDGLLEICERVYVFDCCFTTGALEDQNYKGYVGGIVTQLKEIYPDASILAFNFREGETQSQIGSALSEYDMTIMEYPRHYEGCPLLPMEVMHHFLRSSESWLSLGLQNLLLMHCERGGWPVLAFMLAALLIYRKHYSGELKTLDMVYKQAPRELLHVLSPLNPIPSQLRYLQYVSRRNVAMQWPPLDRALTLDCIMIRMIPTFDGEGGCRPIFRIYGQDPCSVSARGPKVLFSTPKKSRYVRHYKQAECEIVKVDINCHIQGDVVLECVSLHDDMEREVMMFRVMFNTAFIRSNILMLNRDEIDVVWDAKDLFPKDFRAEVLFSEMDTVASVVPVDASCFEEKDGLPVEAFAKVQEIFSYVDWLSPKGEAAVEALQQLAVSNTVIEAYSHATFGVKSLAKSPADSALGNQSNLSRQPSSNADVNTDQSEPQFSPTKIRPIISSKQTLIPSGDHSPPSSTSPYHQLSVTKILRFSPNQQSGSNEIGMFKDVCPLNEAETVYPKHFSPGSAVQTTKDANIVPGRSLLSPSPFPLSLSLEEKVCLQNAPPSLPLSTPEIPSASTPLLKDETVIKPDVSFPSAESARSQDKVVGDEPPESKASLSTALSTKDFVEAPIVANPPAPPPPPPRPPSPPPPPPLIHSSSMGNAVKSTGVGSLSLSTTLSSNLDAVQVTESGSPAPHLPSAKTDATTAPPTSPSPNLDTALIKESSTSICGPTPPASLPPPTSNFKENSECAVGPSSSPSTLHFTDTSAADRALSCSPAPPLPSLPHGTSSAKVGPPLAAPPPTLSPLLKEHYAPEVARPVPCLPSPSPKPPKEISIGGESTPSYSGNDEPSLVTHLSDSLVTGPAPCPPPRPLPPKETSSGQGHSFPPPPSHSGYGTTNLPASSPPTPPPPPVSPTTGNSPSIPSALPPPPASPTTRSSSCVPLAPPPPPASPTTRIPPPPPPASPTTRNSPSIPSAPPPPSPPPPPPPSHATRSFSSVPLAPPPPPASPTTRSSSVPSAPPPPFSSSSDPANLSTSGSTGSSLPGSPSPPGPPPPGIPPPGTKGKSLLSRTIRNNQTKKLKPLHWLKISRAVSGSLWAEAQKSGEASKAPEIDISELESLFSAALPTPDQRSKAGSRASMGSKPEKVQLIEHRRAYNCEIMLSKVKIPLNDMLSSVLALEDSALDVDQVDNLIKFCPTKEEMELLKGYKGERDQLGKCEQFFLELMQVPRTEFKLRVYSFKIQFHSQVSDLRNNLNVVNSASDQIRGSGKLRRIMQTILNLGNALNQGTARGSAVGFRLDSLLKLTDTRARNNKMTLMHYLCKVLSDQLPELLDFWKDLSSLELASKIQLKFLAEEMQAINKGLEKVIQELSMSESDGPVSDQFCKALKDFLCFSEGEVRTMASLYAGVGRNVDSLILYFGEDPARCPFEQVISTLLNFVRMFKQAQDENCKHIEFEKKKAEKEAMERTKMNAATDSGHLLQSEVRSIK